MLHSIPIRYQSLILLVATWFFRYGGADAGTGPRHFPAQQQECDVSSGLHRNIQRTSCRRRRLISTVSLLESVSRGGGDSSSASVPTPTTLRVRLPDGSLHRLVLPTNQWPTLTLNDALATILFGLTDANEEISVKTSSSTQSVDGSQTLAELGLQHGSLVELTYTNKSSKKTPHRPSFSLQQKEQKERFDPYPDLARDYDAAAWRLKRQKRQNRGGGGAASSYAALANLQSELHVVDPQPQGKIQRVYMCAVSASRLQSHCHSSSSSSSTKRKKGPPEKRIENRVGLLLGTIARERREFKKKARTSLSSSVPEDDYCQAVKVHAVWEPPHQTPRYKNKNGSKDPNDVGYDGTALEHWRTRHAAVPRVAKYLGLQPIGWIFTYAQDRSGKDGLPVLARDVQTGATLQIDNMKQPDLNDDSSSSRFVTLAMDSRTGATEAFQLSDVSVQMVAEDMFVLDDSTDTDNTSTGLQKKKDDGVVNGRYVTTRHPVIVDGKETQQLDSVLCLVNTALLSHTGLYAGAGGGGPQGSTKKKNGALTSKTRKAIVQALKDDGGNDGTGKLLPILCDFSVLLALDELLTPQESERLCQVVQKWARGQKKTAKVDDKLIQRLNQVLVE